MPSDRHARLVLIDQDVFLLECTHKVPDTTHHLTHTSATTGIDNNDCSVDSEGSAAEVNLPGYGNRHLQQRTRCLFTEDSMDGLRKDEASQNRCYGADG